MRSPINKLGLGLSLVSGAAVGAVTFAALNPASTGSGIALSNSNRTATHDGTTGDFMTKSTSGKTTGKHYFEFVIGGSAGGNYFSIGIASSTSSLTNFVGQQGGVDSSYGYYGNNGLSYHNTSGIAFGATFGGTDVIGVAVDLSANKIWWSKNNVWQNAGDPANGVNSQYTLTAGPVYHAALGLYDANSVATARFNPAHLSYSPPSGFTAGWTA